MYKESTIFVAGHTGLIGSALVSALREKDYTSILTRTHQELDLTDYSAVSKFFCQYEPDCVFLCAGKVGGIVSNKTYPADYLQINLAIQNSVFEAAVRHDIDHVVFYGSSCMYPRESQQPIREEYLMTGPIEPTSEAYAIAKIAGVVACRAYNQQYKKNRFIALVPNSVYGPHDCFDPDESHVLSALIHRFHEAKTAGIDQVTLWGTGNPRREFIYSDDVAAASLFAVENAEKLENRNYNIGSGRDYSIREIAEMVCDIVGYEGRIVWNTDMPDGAPRKLLDSTDFKARGWKPHVDIASGLKRTYQWYLQQIAVQKK